MAESDSSPKRISASAQRPTDLAALLTGSRESLDQLVPLLYHELRAIAHRQITRRANRGTLQTTGLVHEAYLKVIGRSHPGVHDRAHLLALAALAMRHVLVDRAKALQRLKRGGTGRRITLAEDLIAADQPEALLQVDEALVWLAELEPRLAQVVECRFFGGLSEEEIALALGVTVRTVERDWAKARMLLRRALES